jgi:transcription elongation factor Elf1
MPPSNPIDHVSIAEDAEDEAKKDPRRLGTRRKFTEFECPTCSANNPSEVFGNGDEVICGYCGQGFIARIDNEGTLKLRES